jgi:hypothetical protein
MLLMLKVASFSGSLSAPVLSGVPPKQNEFVVRTALFCRWKEMIKLEPKC